MLKMAAVTRAKAWYRGSCSRTSLKCWPLQLGNERNTVSRVLFRRRELTEVHWVALQARWVLRKTRWVRFGAQRRNSLSSLPGARWAPKNSMSLVFEAVLPETVFGPFPTNSQSFVGCTPRGSCNTTRLLEGFFEGSLTISVSYKGLGRARFLEGA